MTLTLCEFCLDEPSACAHPSCPRGPTRALATPALAARTPTRPSLAGTSPTPVAVVPSRPVPHIGTRPSLTRGGRDEP